MTNLQLTHQSLRVLARHQSNPKFRHEKAFLMHLFGNPFTVDIFEVLIDWLPHGKRADGSIFKSDVDLAHDTGFSPKTVERSRKILKEAGFDIRVMKANGAPTNHYSFNLKKFVAFVARKLQTTQKNIRQWLEGTLTQKVAMETDRKTKSAPPAARQGSRPLSLLDFDQLAETLTTEIYDNSQASEEDTEASTDSEGEVVVVADQSLKGEIEALHLQLGTSEADLQSWIETYGLEKVKALAERAVKDSSIDSKGGWVRFALKNNYQWTDNPQRGKRKAKAEMTEEEYGKSYTTGSKYAAFINH